LVIAANPSLGRTISNGEYFIGGKRITETAFVNDPEFPVSSSLVLKMLGDNGVQVLKHMDALPEQGIVIGEANSNADINAWLSVIDQSWMLVGAGDFYAALLNIKYKPQPQPPVELQSPHLYVSGTAFNERKLQLRKLQDELNCVSYLPETMNAEWLEKTGKILREQKKAVIAIDESTHAALFLRQQMAEAVKKIVERENIKEIFIEGGSTAAAILNELKINQLTPVNELQRGVVRMKANGLLITVKPGSYELPEEILKHYFTK
jgi:D-threonate/D-erythronate kinase